MAAAVTGAVIILLAAVLPRASEPKYKGVCLTTWTENYAEGQPGSGVAIQAIGTKGIPFFLQMIQAKDSVMKRRLLRVLPIQVTSAVGQRSDVHQQLLGWKGFEALGTVATSAVPELALLANDPRTSQAATLALAGIGSSGYEVLTNLLSHTNSQMRFHATMAFAYARSIPEHVVVALSRRLNDQDHIVRWAAAKALADSAAQPTVAVPALIEALQDTNRAVRFNVLEALGKYGQEATPAIGAIRVLTNDPDRLVRQAAFSALDKIQSKATTQEC